jgi:hypothetical protein
MRDDEARRALAIELLRELFTEWEAEGKPWQLFHAVSLAEDAPPIAVYANTSDKGFGSFICKYWLLDPVEKIIANCEHIFDNLTLTAQVKDNPEQTEVINFREEEREPGFREKTVRDMANFATRSFVLSIRSQIVDAIADSFEDSVFLAQSALANDIAESHDASTDAHVALTADSRPLIDQIANKAAKRKRELLVGLLGALPRIITKGRTGRPPGTTKPTEMFQKEKEEFISQIEAAVRKLALAASKVPTKTAVAGELGTGGVNPSTGNDTSLQAFHNKITRYGIDYDQLVFKVMRDLPLNE